MIFTILNNRIHLIEQNLKNSRILQNDTKEHNNISGTMKIATILHSAQSK